VRQRHSSQELLEVAVALCLQEGLGSLTFGRVARAAAVPDRTVVYYFPNKERLLEAVLDVLAQRVLTLLDDGRASTRLPAVDLPAHLWPRLACAQARDVMAVWMELFALGGTRQEPYQRLARRLAHAWLSWLAERVDAPTAQARADGAARALAVLDGALLLRHVGLAAEADAAVVSPAG
jgi:AcrR family transcriptional regulator